ncbi:DUF2939 domain-containing protein [Novosphingobium sp.]|uniref:DUF2939 domain-containing protein n=1 Tax=Novosphingobium sp. TaxID=1874826 RepID=UPI0038B73C10
MKRWIFSGLGAAAAAFAAWFSLSPGLAMTGLRDAVKEANKQELEERVDFPKVRDSLKAQFKAKMASEMAKEAQGEQSGFAALGAMIAMSMVDGLIDGLITPDGMKALIENGRFKRQDEAASAPAKEVDWKIERDGLDRFRAVPAGDNNPPTLVFKRDGLGWDLVDIEIPAGDE